MEKLAVKNETQVKEDKANAKAMQSSNKGKAQAAFNQIYKRYKSPIFYMALRYVKMNEETAEDLTQEIFVKIWEKVKSYDHTVAFSTWFYNLAKNHLIDHKRRHKVEVLSMETLRSEYGGDEDANEIAFQLEDKSADTFKEVLKGERAIAVLDALNNGVKNEEAKQIITLIFFEDMPYEKVAKQMKLPEGTVKNMMFRAKNQMKEYLSKKSKDFSYAN